MYRHTNRRTHMLDLTIVLFKMLIGGTIAVSFRLIYFLRQLTKCNGADLLMS